MPKATDLHDTAALVLMGVLSGEVLDARDGELGLWSAGRFLPVPIEVLDFLEHAGLVVIGERGAAATRNGRKAVEEWFRKRFKGRKLDVSKLRPATFSASPRRAVA